MEGWIRFNIYLLLGTIAVIIIFCLLSCTTSINFVHSEGTTTDLIDGIQQTTPTVSPTIDVPI